MGCNVSISLSLGREIDLAARAPLWEVGLRYGHGTGHGIGAYLSVHEGNDNFFLYTLMLYRFDIQETWGISLPLK